MAITAALGQVIRAFMLQFTHLSNGENNRILVGWLRRLNEVTHVLSTGLSLNHSCFFFPPSKLLLLAAKHLHWDLPSHFMSAPGYGKLHSCPLSYGAAACSGAGDLMSLQIA